MAWESPLQSGSKSYSHKRRNARFKGAWRVHTPPCPPNRAHSSSHGQTGGYSDGGGYSYPQRALRGPEPLCVQRSEGILCHFCMGQEDVEKKQRAFGTETRIVRVSVPRRRGPAGLRDPVAVPLTALIGFTILLSRIVAHRKLSACSLVTAVRFLNRCSRRSMRETYPLGQRSGCRF